MNAIEPDAHATSGHNQEFKQQDHRNQTPSSLSVNYNHYSNRSLQGLAWLLRYCV